MITGRLTELINIDGIKVSPRRVEAVLEDADGVIGAACFLDTWSKPMAQLAAFVEFSGEFDEQSIRDFCRTRVGTDVSPTRVIAVESIPRTAKGALDRSAINQIAKDLLNA